jgi:hypothetical protein
MIDQQTYNREIASIAKEIAEECFVDDCLDVHELAHEYVDGHQWIIYYRYHNSVIDYSNNPEAVFDQGMQESLSCASSVKDLLQICAFWAMLQDVLESAETYLEELREALEDKALTE